MMNLCFNLCVLIFLACFSIPICCFDTHKALFVFGDSMFDQGNNIYDINLYRADFSPYGESYFKHPSGRFSDGRIIPDFIAEFGNLPMIPSYHQALHNHSSIHGVSFASGGGGCLDETFPGKTICLNKQFRHFEDVAERLKTQLGKRNLKKYLSNAVYLFSIGNNDYLRLFEIPDVPSSITCLAYTTEQEYMHMVMHNFVTVIKEIYKLGGRKFGIQSLLPLGCLPRFRGITYLQEGRVDCLEKLNSIAKRHSLAVLEKLRELKKELKGFEYSFFNIFDALNDLFDNPSAHGFTEAKSGCCGFGPYNGFGTCGISKDYALCKNVNEHVIFDSYHPTQKACYHLAQKWWQGISHMVEPQSLKSLFYS